MNIIDRLWIAPLWRFHIDGNEIPLSEFVFPSVSCRLILTPEYLESTDLDGVERWKCPYSIVPDGNDTNRTNDSFLLLCIHILLDKQVFIDRYFYRGQDRNPVNPKNRIVPVDLEPHTNLIFIIEELKTINDFLPAFLGFVATKGRATNALFLLQQGLFQWNWVPAHLLWVCALETLFDTQGSGSKLKLANRITAFLGDESPSKDQIKRIYTVRSEIAHGNMHLHLAKSDSVANLELLRDTWSIARLCFRKLLVSGLYQEFQDEVRYKCFISQLDS